MAASGRATWHADVSMTSSGGAGCADVSMAHADVSVDQVNTDLVNGQWSLGAHLSVGGSHRQVGPACHCREKEKEKKNARRRAESLHGLLFLLGLLGRTQPILLSSVSFSSHPAAADNSGPLVGDSWIPCGLLPIRCEL